MREIDSALSLIAVRSRSLPAWLAVLYTLLLFSLLPVQSLWLDELMQTAAARDLPLGVLLYDKIPRIAGQVPLVYVLQKASFSLLGFSHFSARLPAAVLAVLAAVGVWRLSNWAQLRAPLLAVALFVSFPLQLRYATEARPYSHALCVSVWLTVLFVRLPEQAGWRPWCGYAALLVLGLYTQPYVLFVATAHALYALRDFTQRRVERRFFRSLMLAVAAAVALFLPWYLSVRTAWRDDVNGSNVHFHRHAGLPLEVARELTGAGYIATVLLLVLCFFAFKNRSAIPASKRLLLLLILVVPAIGAIAADATFDYFFAIRQLIFVLPPLAILSAAGLEALGGRMAAALALVLLSLNIGYSVRWFTKPRENWGAAAAQLDRGRKAGACLILLPTGTGALYNFYVPELSASACTSEKRAATNAIYVAVSPYFRDAAAEASLQSRLEAEGFSLKNSGRRAEPHILMFERRSR